MSPQQSSSSQAPWSVLRTLIPVSPDDRNDGATRRPRSPTPIPMKQTDRSFSSDSYTKLLAAEDAPTISFVDREMEAEYTADDEKSPRSSDVSEYDEASGASSKDISLKDYANRMPWLRAAVLGGTDGLVSVAAIMMGVGGGGVVDGGSAADYRSMVIAGVAALVAGSLSMACGEYVSVASQRDVARSSLARVRADLTSRSATPSDPSPFLHRYTQVQMERGMSRSLAHQIALEVHAQHDDDQEALAKIILRDEMGIDLGDGGDDEGDAGANPVMAAGTSAAMFCAGGILPLLAGGFIPDYTTRIVLVATVCTLGLMLGGTLGAWVGGAPLLKGALRVLVGGWIAMVTTFAAGWLVGA
ncbi:hypothetical protein HDV00_010545 [Rhizophlyctis rosea]|nr:hypothetical protein HDV00_010545 [Rhizophlyctis rosea]